MPFDPISWAIIGFVIGALTATFWDEITEWASQALEDVLKVVGLAFSVVANSVVYLLKKGHRVYKKIEVEFRNIFVNDTGVRCIEREISSYDVPDELNDEVNRRTKVKILQQI